MKTIFSALALLFVGASVTAIWSSLTVDRSRRQRLLAAAWVLAFAELGGTGLIFWTVKDGLGPDSVTSHGLEAMARFARSAWFPFLVIVALPAVCSVAARAKRIRNT